MSVIEAGFDIGHAKADADRRFTHKRLTALAVPAVILAYLVYVFFAFDMGGLIQRARFDNAAILIGDTWSHKVHVSRDNRLDRTVVSVEGESKGTYPDDKWPQWVSREGESVVSDLGRFYVVRFDPDAVRFAIPDYGQLVVRQSRSGIEIEAPAASLPGWINASNTRVTVTTPAGRLSVTKTRAEVFRYFAGWPLFFFDLQSPFHEKSWPELAALAVSSDQLRPGEANVAAMASDFWNNGMWRHRDVAWAMFETVLMAFLGTIGGALVALPLAFLSARNFAPNFLARFGVRRLFDFLRGVDGLIWTIVLSRAFGPGPLTGSLAMLLTDTGTFGKLFSEALENVDDKQVEGVRSTGASTMQRYRFGVMPQVSPVMLSQVLYMLESNTRSATVIGAIVGGGIGLLLTQAIQTQKDWEDVAYYIVLTLVMVSIMDVFSGWLRRKLIGTTGGSSTH